MSLTKDGAGPQLNARARRNPQTANPPAHIIKATHLGSDAKRQHGGEVGAVATVCVETTLRARTRRAVHNGVTTREQRAQDSGLRAMMTWDSPLDSRGQSKRV